METRLLPKLVQIALIAAMFSLLSDVVGAQAPQSWNLKGNAGTDPATNFLGATDGKPLIIQPRNGNVGIGTTGPNTKLTVWTTNAPGVQEGIRINAPFGFGGNGNGSSLVFSQDRSPSENNINAFIQGVQEGALTSERAYLAFGTRSGVGPASIVNEKMRITSAGNVGIGTMDPQAKLDVAGMARTAVLQITGGSDLAEPFEFSGAIKPGMVVAIDPERPGRLRIADKAYDRTVAGIVSGANGINPGLIMKQQGTVADGSLTVALTGRVYCWADASDGPISPGDLLTASNTPGHAMKVTDYAKANGATVGKAMTKLERGKGLVLVLVTLQ
jgi:hypothetical protein